ncbi:hypothetical protein HDU96_000774 [Phlyctochytrium bullatum]|nr:hypothetical protein HDU96_000774 [Phlyctochytrium bullatum]
MTTSTTPTFSPHATPRNPTTTLPLVASPTPMSPTLQPPRAPHSPFKSLSFASTVNPTASPVPLVPPHPVAACVDACVQRDDDESETSGIEGKTAATAAEHGVGAERDRAVSNNTVDTDDDVKPAPSGSRSPQSDVIVFPVADAGHDAMAVDAPADAPADAAAEDSEEEIQLESGKISPVPAVGYLLALPPTPLDKGKRRATGSGGASPRVDVRRPATPSAMPPTPVTPGGGQVYIPVMGGRPIAVNPGGVAPVQQPPSPRFASASPGPMYTPQVPPPPVGGYFFATGPAPTRHELPVVVARGATYHPIAYHGSSGGGGGGAFPPSPAAALDPSVTSSSSSSTSSTRELQDDEEDVALLLANLKYAGGGGDGSASPGTSGQQQHGYARDEADQSVTS